jgi:hypothetical protein
MNCSQIKRRYLRSNFLFQICENYLAAGPDTHRQIKYFIGLDRIFVDVELIKLTAQIPIKLCIHVLNYPNCMNV